MSTPGSSPAICSPENAPAHFRSEAFALPPGLPISELDLHGTGKLDIHNDDEGQPAMGIEDNPAFPRFNSVSTGLRDAEERLLQALKDGKKADIVSAKVGLMGALDEYSKFADGIDKEVV